MITQQYPLSSELQAFLSGIESNSMTNVLWNVTFTDDAPALPSNPTAVRRSLMFSRLDWTDDATPTEEYNAYIQNLDGSSEQPVSVPRGL